MPELTLYSKQSCPYVQRAMIALGEKDAVYRIVYVDTAEKPDWFMQISPSGKVPVLKISQTGKPDASIFESSVILEYIEEGLPGPKLHPDDPVERAQARSWMEFGSAMLPELYSIWIARAEDDFVAARDKVAAKFAYLAKSLGVGPYFHGNRFGCVDVIFAPLFNRLEVFESLAAIDLLRPYPKVMAWSAALADRASVRQSMPKNHAETLLNALNLTEGYAMQRLLP
ncbi:glutathione S-transferase family protein [Novosphingobium malaysiense]|uniref:glutathione transferase n=1 Tax=Novosphingobium malaysiense TaxID=1348853 RepID=A0A0B1ZM73_9SPHN|nr:glutathione S-transferase family protein [Novosphingobium malaysiense]KHK90298.1 hypothetical protein LK12_16900 [Novosphingobium malaysiense]